MSTSHRRAPPPPQAAQAGFVSPSPSFSPGGSAVPSSAPSPYCPPPPVHGVALPVHGALPPLDAVPPPRPPKPSGVVLNPWQMSQEQQQEYKTTPATVDLDASRTALANLRESEAIAIASADALYDQGEQIDRMHQSTLEMSAQLTHADRLVKGIGSWKHTITNTFTDVDTTTANSKVGKGHRDAEGNVISDKQSILTGPSGPPPVRREFKPTAPREAGVPAVEEVVLKEKIHDWRKKAAADTPAAAESRIPKQWSKKPAVPPGTVGLSSNATREQQIMFEAQQTHLEEMVQIMDNLGEINVMLGDTAAAQTKQLEDLNLDAECVQFQLERTNERIGKIVD